MIDVTTDQHYESPTLTITNARGQPAPVDGVPVWASSDDLVMAIKDVAADGMSAASIEFVGEGTAHIVVTADADRGAGVSTITFTSEEHNVTIGPKSVASHMVLSLGTPTDKP